MYQQTVTVFNKYTDSQKRIYWYPHVISGVDLILNKGANIVKTGFDGSDTAKLHVRCVNDTGEIRINDMKWLPPKTWRNQEESGLRGSVTFATGDFFALGGYVGDVIADEDYVEGVKTTGFFDYMNRHQDYVFLITTVDGPYTLIPHFEIGGK